MAFNFKVVFCALVAVACLVTAIPTNVRAAGERTISALCRNCTLQRLQIYRYLAVLAKNVEQVVCLDPSFRLRQGTLILDSAVHPRQCDDFARPTNVSVFEYEIKSQLDRKLIKMSSNDKSSSYNAAGQEKGDSASKIDLLFFQMLALLEKFAITSDSSLLSNKTIHQDSGPSCLIPCIILVVGKSSNLFFPIFVCC